MGKILRGITASFVLFCCTWFLISIPSTAWGAAPADRNKSIDMGEITKTLTGPSYGTWQIDADKITYDENSKAYEADGNVRIWSGDRSIRADSAVLDTVEHKVQLRGNVQLQYGKDWLRGDHIVWNLEKETGWVDGGIMFFAENHFYVKGGYIAKTGPNQYEMKDGYLTSCDPENSDWKIRYGYMKLNLDGMGWARNTSFLVRDIPVLYSPYIALPVQQNRQSGFLIPWGGYSDLNGIQAELPFYWAIRQDMDATFYGRIMEKRGWMSGLEYRIANERWGEGIWLFHYVNDLADSDYQESHGYPLQTRDRYWLRTRHSIDLPLDVQGRLDLDLVSDRFFLREFDKGSSSYGFSNKAFLDYAGRGILNDKTVLARESTMYLFRPEESSLIGIDFRYWDQLDKAIDEYTLQRLPSLSFNVIPSGINQFPLYYTLDSSIVNYWRREGDTGDRLDVHPRAYYPLHWLNYLDVEPSIGIRGNTYWVDWEEDSRDELQGRFFSDLSLTMSTRLNRVYPLHIGNYVAVQHAVRPEITYEYVPEQIEGDVPLFDRLDEDKSRHDVRYGFTTFLTMKESNTDSDGNTKAMYREVARLKLFHAYNIESSPADFPDARLVTERQEGFSDVGMLLDIMPGKYVTLTYDAAFSPEDASSTRQDVYMTLNSEKGHIFRLDYVFRRDSLVDEIIPQLNVKVLPGLYLMTYHDYSLEQDELYSHGYGIRYEHGCWAVGVAFEREDEDNRVAVSLNLLGLGTIKAGGQPFTGMDSPPRTP